MTPLQNRMITALSNINDMLTTRPIKNRTELEKELLLEIRAILNTDLSSPELQVTEQETLVGLLKNIDHNISVLNNNLVDNMKPLNQTLKETNMRLEHLNKTIQRR